MPQAHLSELAKEDTFGIAAYIEADRPDAARRFLHAVKSTQDLLAAMPSIGHQYQHPRHPELLCHSVQGFRKYLVFYTPAEDGILVVRVLHGHRDIPAVLDE